MKLRRWAFQAVLLVIAMISLCVLCIGCREKQVTIPIPKINPEALRSAAEGDAHLREGHLYGWRQAEAAYQQAYNLAGSEEYKKKLLLSRFLILTRQIDEDIPYSRLDEVIKEICSGDESRKDLCDIAQWYKAYKKLNPPDIQYTTLFGGEQPELEEYFKRLLAPPGNFSPDIRIESAGELSGESPLLLYLSPGKLGTRDPAEIEKTHPGFAEALEYLGESLFQRKKYGAARNCFRKALDLIPDYTRAINGLGNIYFFGLEDYEQALHWYESALDRDPTNTAAQFGKGAALHKLGKYAESNATFDRMLSSEHLRDGRLDESGYRYYSGEGNYLKAYNYRLMDDLEKPRELIDLARKFLPDSEEINEFSGVLYFKAQKLEEARKDFIRVLAKQNSSCSAQMYMGLIYHQMKYSGTGAVAEKERERRELNYFLDACSCMESGIQQLRFQIDSVPSLDLETREKVLLSSRLRSKLLDYRMASTADIQRMIDNASQTAAVERETHLKLIREILGRIQMQ
jgi:tetratricopeptide (TPR) repeat protein